MRPMYFNSRGLFSSESSKSLLPANARINKSSRSVFIILYHSHYRDMKSRRLNDFQCCTHMSFASINENDVRQNREAASSDSLKTLRKRLDRTSAWMRNHPVPQRCGFKTLRAPSVRFQARQTPPSRPPYLFRWCWKCHRPPHGTFCRHIPGLMAGIRFPSRLHISRPKTSSLSRSASMRVSMVLTISIISPDAS